jgi:hypothetical protein
VLPLGEIITHAMYEERLVRLAEDVKRRIARMEESLRRREYQSLRVQFLSCTDRMDEIISIYGNSIVAGMPLDGRGG